MKGVTVTMSILQDLISKFSKNNSDETYREIINNIKTADTLWIAATPATKSYYLGFSSSKPAAYIFSEKEYFEKYSEAMKEKDVHIDAIENKAENRLNLFSDFYRCGYDYIIVDDGQVSVTMSIYDIINKPDYSAVPEAKRPVINPVLIRTVNNLFQRLNAKQDVQGAESQMYLELHKAKFLIPIERDEMNMESVNKEEGTGVIKENSKIKIPIIENQQVGRFFPVFTDWTELRKFNNDGKFASMVATFDDLKQLAQQTNGVVLNPKGFNLVLKKEIFEQIEAVVTSSDGNIHSETIKEDTPVKLGIPKNYPQEMINAVVKFFKEDGRVNAAFFMNMIMEDKENHLFVLDFDGDKDDVLSSIVRVASPYADGMAFTFVPLFSDFGQQAVKNLDPIYVK